MSRALELSRHGSTSGIATVAGLLKVDQSNDRVNVGTALTIHSTGYRIGDTNYLHSNGFQLNNLNITGVATVTTLSVTGGVTGGVNASGVGTVAYLQNTNINSSGIVTASSFSGTTATFTNLTVNGGITGAVNNTGVGTLAYLQNTNINSSGIHTASSFSGALANTLTLGTSGTGLSGSTTFNNSGAATFTVTSNATNANTASAIVSRDASGNFSAGTITAVGGLAGNINATGVSTVAFLQATTVNVGYAATVGGDLTVTGNLTVNGTTTNLNTVNLVIEDKNIILANVATPTDVTADGGGITLKGATDKTFNWVSANTAWTSSEDLNVVTGKQYKINGTSVLTSTTLGSGVVNSSLTSVGTLGNLTVSGGITGAVNNAGVGTVAFLQATTVNVGSAATIPTLSGTTATFTNLTINGGITGAVNNAGVGTVAYLRATTVNATGVCTASSFSGSGSGITGLTNSNLSGTAGITNANLANSTISGVALGSNLSALTISTGLSGSSYNGSGGVTIAIDSTVCTLTGSQTLTNKTIGIATISGDQIPNANNTINLGSSANRWANVYSNDLDLSNEGTTNSIDGTWGSYLIQEGEESLYIINRRSGKKFRFVLEELV